MNAEFYQGNRQRLYDSLPDHTLLLLFSGSSIRKTADENYPFYADRSFLYLTGIGQEHTVLMAEKDGEEVQETLYTLPPNSLPYFSTRSSRTGMNALMLVMLTK